MNAVLYALVVLIFGTTWIAITLQSAEIAPVVAVFWRFFIAGALDGGAPDFKTIDSPETQ